MATEQDRASPNRFPTTRLSLVAAAGGQDTQSRDALATLCQVYWYPLYAYIRRQGHTADQANDLTQGFVARLLEKNTVRKFRRERGRFRSFLIASLKNFLANESEMARAQKRGGGLAPVSLENIRSGETRYRLEPRDHLTPERIFEKQWALALLDRAMARLREEFAQAGKSAQFEALRGYLSGGSEIRYGELAARLGMSEGAVKVAVHRLRQRFHEALRDEVSCTVGNPDETGAEIRHLIAVLAG
jgi:RNA polymerase sigma-70 factor (ECF subfamily)